MCTRAVIVVTTTLIEASLHGPLRFQVVLLEAATVAAATTTTILA